MRQRPGKNEKKLETSHIRRTLVRLRTTAGNVSRQYYPSSASREGNQRAGDAVLANTKLGKETKACHLRSAAIQSLNALFAT